MLQALEAFPRNGRSVPVSRSEPRAEWRPSSVPSRHLAACLRRSRLTVLFGAEPAELKALLTAGLVPLLARRRADADPAAPATEIDEPHPDPARFRARTDPRTELMVLVDAARTQPADALRTGFEAAVSAVGLPPDGTSTGLVQRLRGLADSHPLRCLFLITGFDSASADEGAAPASPLVDELLDLVGSDAPAHVLLLMNAATKPQVRALTARVSTASAEWLELRSPASAPGVPAAPRLQDLDARDRRAAEDADPSAGLESGSGLGEFAGEPSGPTRQNRRVLAGVALFLVVAALAIAVGRREPTDDLFEARVARGLRAAEAPPAIPIEEQHAPAAPFGLLVESEGDLPPRAARELAIALGAASGLRPPLQAARSVAAGLEEAFTAGAASLAIVRYDGMKAAAAAAPGLAVVAPLYAEELFVLVPANSPLRFLHELKGRRINVGPSDGGRAVTGKTLYESMFDSPLPAAPAGFADAPAALRLMLQGRQFDAVVLAGPHLEELLAPLSTVERAGLRLLAFAPNDPVGRKALRAYLPSTANGPSGQPVPTLASLDFLVAAAATEQQQSNALVDAVGSLCRHLPALQREGDPKWRTVQPGLQLQLSIRQVRMSSAAPLWTQCGAPDEDIRRTSSK